MLISFGDAGGGGESGVVVGATIDERGEEIALATSSVTVSAGIQAIVVTLTSGPVAGGTAVSVVERPQGLLISSASVKGTSLSEPVRVSPREMTSLRESSMSMAFTEVLTGWGSEELIGVVVMPSNESPAGPGVSVSVSTAGVLVEERVVILDVRCRFVRIATLEVTESPDDDPSPLKLPGSSSSLSVSPK